MHFLSFSKLEPPHATHFICLSTHLMYSSLSKSTPNLATVPFKVIVLLYRLYHGLSIDCRSRLRLERSDMGFLSPEKSSLMSTPSSRNRECQSKTIVLEHFFPRLLSLMNFHVSVSVMSLFAQNFMTACCPKRAVSMRF